MTTRATPSSNHFFARAQRFHSIGPRAVLLLLLLAGVQPAHAELVAERITTENFDSHHVGGPDSIAGIDDWFISNGTLCAALPDTYFTRSLGLVLLGQLLLNQPNR